MRSSWVRQIIDRVRTVTTDATRTDGSKYQHSSTANGNTIPIRNASFGVLRDAGGNVKLSLNFGWLFIRMLWISQLHRVSQP
jgi:hypothetical protein